MKVLLIDSRIDGHHLTYMKSIMEVLQEAKFETVVCIPVTIETLSKCRLYIYNRENYFKWIYYIKKLIEKEKPDIVHFLYGDDLYPFFGAGLRMLKKYSKIIITLHQIRRSFLHDLSIKMIAKNADKVIVHTEVLKRDLNKINIFNIKKIEYPHFSKVKTIDKKKALGFLGIKKCDAPVLVALGGTRYDKGLDILLKALVKVPYPFHLIIAGVENDFSKEFILKNIKTYKNKVTYILKFLSDAEFAYCLSASDIVCLPYRKSFDGASGPLGEGVALGKMVIGTDHGSLGDLIKTNHLGFTFKSENVDDLAIIINKAIKMKWHRDSKYLCYQQCISEKMFQENYIKQYYKLSKKERG